MRGGVGKGMMAGDGGRQGGGPVPVVEVAGRGLGAGTTQHTA